MAETTWYGNTDGLVHFNLRGARGGAVLALLAVRGGGAADPGLPRCAALAVRVRGGGGAVVPRRAPLVLARRDAAARAAGAAAAAPPAAERAHPALPRQR